MATELDIGVGQGKEIDCRTCLVFYTVKGVVWMKRSSCWRKTYSIGVNADDAV